MNGRQESAIARAAEGRGGYRNLQAGWRHAKKLSRCALCCAATLALLGGGAAGKPADNGHVEAKQGRTAFFERPAALAAARKSDVPAPVLILLSSDPWAIVIGSGSPAFALYADGTVIYRTANGYVSAKLDKAQQEDLLHTLDLDTLSRVAGYYEASYSTDQPVTNLLSYAGNKPFFISLYGSMTSPEVRAKIPDRITAAYDKLSSFRLPRAQPWLPVKIEVMVWPYEYAPEASIEWPKNWPDLQDPTTRKRGKDSFSIYVPSSEFPALRAFLRTRKEKGAVSINGKKWAASLRFPFPHEAMWTAPKSE